MPNIPGMTGPARIEILKATRNILGLLKELASSDASFRAAAAKTLGDYREASVVEPVAALLQDGEKTVRDAAAAALGNIGAPALQALTAVMSSGNDEARSAAADALGRIGAPALEQLLACLKDASADVRVMSALWLGKIRDPRAVEPLIAAFKDENRDVRVEVVKALGELRDARALELLTGALKDSDDGISRAATKALVRIDPAKAGATLINALKNTKSEALQEMIAGKLGDTGDPGAVQPLLDLLEDENSRKVRENAARSLVKLYRSNALGQTEKQLILDQQETIVSVYGAEFTI